MTKEQVLGFISQMDWQTDPWKKSEKQEEIEKAVASYVVYKLDPDTHRPYAHKYHLTQKVAMEDFESRTTNDCLCYCVISELGSEWRQERTLSRPLTLWE